MLVLCPIQSQVSSHVISFPASFITVPDFLRPKEIIQNPTLPNAVTLLPSVGDQSQPDLSRFGFVLLFIDVLFVDEFQITAVVKLLGVVIKFYSIAVVKTVLFFSIK